MQGLDQFAIGLSDSSTAAMREDGLSRARMRPCISALYIGELGGDFSIVHGKDAHAAQMPRLGVAHRKFVESTAGEAYDAAS
jgi:hypothetical protein